MRAAALRCDRFVAIVRGLLTLRPFPADRARLRRPLLLLAFTLAAGTAHAQMQLPGAVAPTDEGVVTAPAAPKPKRAGPPPPVKVPSDDGLLGRTLMQNGRAGVMQFSRDGKDLRLSKMVFGGEKISRPAESCTVERPSVALTADGRPDGVTRYNAPVAACPITFDVLDGAILVAARDQVCEFTEADCRVDPAGLWGQPANEIGAARSKEIERGRPAAEQTMRNHFRAWIEASDKNRDMIRKVSRYQAGFSSSRAEICDHYARESEHGYCSLVLTQARAVALAARIALPDTPEPEPTGKRRR